MGRDKDKGFKYIKLFHKLKNMASWVFDPDFRSFKRYEYQTVPMEELGDLNKLKFVRDIQLATSGFISPSLEEHMSLLKRENRLYKMDVDITPFGRIQLQETDGSSRYFLLGYHEKSKKLYVSSRKANNCSIWHRYQEKQLIKQIGYIYPVNNEFFYLKNRFFDKDMAHLQADEKIRLRQKFNTFMELLYKHNPHLGRGVQHIPPQQNDLSQISNVRPIQLEKGIKGLYVPSNIGKNYVVLTPYLEAIDQNNVKYLSLSEFRTLINEKAITPFSETKYGADLGLFGDQLHIKIHGPEGETPQMQKWMSLDDFLNSSEISAKMKYEVTHFLIEKKDFLTHLTAVPIEGNDSKLIIKKHHGTGIHYYAIEPLGKKSMPTDFRPIEHLRKKYPEIYHIYDRHMGPSHSKEERRKTIHRTTRL
ncbi:MAG: hypothetical protein AAF969_01585 [Bacteroidota bacterium]